jgi:hypothetical protein
VLPGMIIAIICHVAVVYGFVTISKGVLYESSNYIDRDGIEFIGGLRF